MANTPSPEPLLFGQPTEAEIAIVDEALTAFEIAHRYQASLEPIGPDREALFRLANCAQRMLERLSNDRPRGRGVSA